MLLLKWSEHWRIELHRNPLTPQYYELFWYIHQVTGPYLLDFYSIYIMLCQDGRDLKWFLGCNRVAKYSVSVLMVSPVFTGLVQSQLQGVKLPPHLSVVPLLTSVVIDFSLLFKWKTSKLCLCKFYVLKSPHNVVLWPPGGSVYLQCWQQHWNCWRKGGVGWLIILKNCSKFQALA